ncbi:MAG: hypothetical protein ACKOED_06760 [Aestuariivirga sp.]|uniref:hypothetical protein n=1 Tax=Aestuariivirga sp. TaxID=2650926 RepID=UPI0038D15444
MKSILSAAAPLAAIASPAFADSAAPQTPAQPVVEIVPAAATPPAGEAQTAAGLGHGCGAKQEAALTN